MVRLFGRDYTRAELTARVGDMRQVAGITAMELADGPERGVRALLFRTGSGFAFTVLADRGLDIFSAELSGASLSTGSRPPAPPTATSTRPTARAFSAASTAGMVVTCGFNNVGNANTDAGQPLNLHGIASYLPARRAERADPLGRRRLRVARQRRDAPGPRRRREPGLDAHHHRQTGRVEVRPRRRRREPELRPAAADVPLPLQPGFPRARRG